MIDLQGQANINQLQQNCYKGNKRKVNLKHLQLSLINGDNLMASTRIKKLVAHTSFEIIVNINAISNLSYGRCVIGNMFYPAET